MGIWLTLLVAGAVSRAFGEQARQPLNDDTDVVGGLLGFALFLLLLFAVAVVAIVWVPVALYRWVTR